MSKKLKTLKTTLDRSVTIEKVLEGELLYKVEKGTFTFPVLTECQKKLLALRDCLRERVKVTCIISPESGQYWNWYEGAYLIVRVSNWTGAFLLKDIEIRPVSLIPLEGRASVNFEDPSTKTIDLLKPGWVRSVSFPLVCGVEFTGDDRVKAAVRIKYKAVPYVSTRHWSEEEILRGE